MEPDNMRADLDAAFAEAEKESGEDELEADSSPTPTPQALLSDKTPIGEGEGDGEEGDKEDGEKELPGTGKEEKAAKGEEGAKEAPGAGDEKAPAGWKATAREKWAQVDPEIKAEITRREKAYSSGIQQYAEAAKFGRAVQETLTPYQQIIAMEGGDPVTAVKNLAHHAATLRIGTDQQKAETVANLIKSYKVDIETLDRLLVGEDPIPPEHKGFLDLLDKRLSPVEEFIQTIGSARKQAVAGSANSVSSEVAAFESNPENEFVNDVRGDMADILELAAKRGQTMTLQDAYNRAVKMNPEISEVLTKRAEQARIAEARKRTAGKAAAASSVASRPGGASSGAAASLRDELAAAWDAHTTP